jgi:hypothetical protein
MRDDLDEGGTHEPDDVELDILQDVDESIEPNAA